MSDESAIGTGRLGWLDLTVEDAQGVRDFYSAVVGWQAEGVSMGEYEDFTMKPPDGDAVAGICHARGGNSAIPPTWLPYFTVDDLDRALSEVERRGGEVVVPTRTMGSSRYCIVRDPAGAVAALWQSI